MRGLLRSRKADFRTGRFRTRSGVLIENDFINREKKSTLVFVNGWTLDFTSWMAQRKNFSEYNLLFLNNRGHGNTELGNSTVDSYLYDCTQDTMELLTHLELRKIHMAGHSMGALILTEFYSRYSKEFDIRSLTFVNPVVGNPMTTFHLSDMVTPLLSNSNGVTITEGTIASAFKFLGNPITGKMPLRLYHQYFKLLTGSKVSFELFRSYYESIFRVDKKTFILALKAMIATGDEIREKMIEIRCPVLSMFGGKDFFVDPDQSFAMLRALIPHALAIMFESSTHFVQAEEVDVFDKALGDLLRKAA